MPIPNKRTARRDQRAFVSFPLRIMFDFRRSAFAILHFPFCIPHSRLTILLLALMSFGCDPAPLTDTGVIGVFGSVGLGPGSFHYPRAITVDPVGSLFVVDKSGRVQRFSADGVYQTSWRMPDTSAGFPVGLSHHPDGRIFVADTHCHRISVFDRDGNPAGAFGSVGTGDAEFLLPTDVTFDAAGNIYVSEYGGNDRISVWSSDITFIKHLGFESIAGARLSRPSGIDIDDEQTLWIADACNHRIIRLSLDGEVLTVFGSFGDAPGQMRYPYDLCVTPEQTLLVCEYEGNRLQWFHKDGRSLRTWGHAGRHPGELFAPWGACVGPGGRLYIVDSLNNRVQIVQP